MPQYVFRNSNGKWIGQLRKNHPPRNYNEGYNAQWFYFRNREQAKGYAKALNDVFVETYKELTTTEAKKQL